MRQTTAGLQTPQQPVTHRAFVSASRLNKYGISGFPMIKRPFWRTLRTDAPRNRCGLIIPCEQERYLPCQNQSPGSLNTILLSGLTILSRAGGAGRGCGCSSQSRGGQPYLSSADGAMQINSGLPWLLVCDEKIHRYEPVAASAGAASLCTA